MHFKKISLVSGILLVTIGVFTPFFSRAQKTNTGSYFMALANDYADLSKYDSAALYYDSAFHQYINQKHIASATFAYHPLATFLQDSLMDSDSTHFYLRTIYEHSLKYRKYDNNKNILSVKKSLASYYFENNRFDSTRVILSNLIPLSTKVYGSKSAQNTSIYRMQSLLDYYEGDIADASYWIKTSLKTRNKTSKRSEFWIDYLEYNFLTENTSVLEELVKSKGQFPEKEQIIAIYNSLKTYYDGKFDQSVNEFKAINVVNDTTSSIAIRLKYNFLNSLLLLEKGEYDESLKVAKEYLDVAKEVYTESHPITASYYAQICRIYNEKSDYGAAREFIEKIISEMESELVYGHPLKAEAYFEYSRLLTALENHETARHLIDSAITIRMATTRVDDIFLGRSYNQKGLLMYHLNELDSSEMLLLRAFHTLNNNLINKQHIYIAKVFNDLGRLYQIKEIDPHSIKNYIKSLQIYRTLLGRVHPYLGAGYYNVGTLYARNRKHRTALKYFQQSIISNVFDFEDTSMMVNPKLSSVMSDIILLKSLTGKVEALEQLYDETADLKLLEAAFSTYELISSLIDKLRTGYVSQESKQFLGKKTAYIYERAIQLCTRLASITDNDEYFKKAFFFSEKSRAGILLSSIKDANTKKISGVPDSLLLNETTMLRNISEKETSLFNELNKGLRARKETINQLQDELFNLKNDHNDFIAYLETAYPRYYQLKYDIHSASVKEVQSEMLNPINDRDKKNYILQEYFIGHDSIYIFHITQDTFSLFIKNKPTKFDGLIKGVRNTLQYNWDDEFLKLSKQLYEVLIPVAFDKRTHVTVIPDGVLSYLPFESLLYQLNQKKSLKKQRFLMNEVTISYSYSATLSVEMAREPYEYDDNTSFVGFAPVFNKQQQFKVLSSDKGTEVITPADSAVSFSSNYEKLQKTEVELERIAKKLINRNFDTNAYFYNSASKENVYNDHTLDCRFVHFATHGILDEEHPDFSGVILADSTEAVTLTLGDIYGINTSAELVALSGCETGLGQLHGGEGLVSFSRGFFFAGSKFIIVSLWEVSDDSSADTMINFYKYYGKKKRQDIYTCFQKAKQKVLKKKKYNSLKDWFPFVMVGMH